MGPEQSLGMPISMRGGAGYNDDQLICDLLIYLFIYFQNSSGMQSVYNQYFKNSLYKYCQPETTKRVVSCFSRLLNLVDEQLSMLEFIYKFNLYTRIMLPIFLRFCLILFVYVYSLY